MKTQKLVIRIKNEAPDSSWQSASVSANGMFLSFACRAKDKHERDHQSEVDGNQSNSSIACFDLSSTTTTYRVELLQSGWLRQTLIGRNDLYIDLNYIALTSNASEPTIERLSLFDRNNACSATLTLRITRNHKVRKLELRRIRCLSPPSTHSELTARLGVLALLAAFVACNAAIMCCLEGWRFVPALWFTLVTATTVGFGDMAPKTTGSRRCCWDGS